MRSLYGGPLSRVPRHSQVSFFTVKLLSRLMLWVFAFILVCWIAFIEFGSLSRFRSQGSDKHDSSANIRVDEWLQSIATEENQKIRSIQAFDESQVELLKEAKLDQVEITRQGANAPDSWLHRRKPSCDSGDIVTALKDGSKTNCPSESTRPYTSCPSSRMLSCPQEIKKVRADDDLRRQKVDKLWLFHGRATVGRVYVVVTSHAPLRAYVLPSVHFETTAEKGSLDSKAVMLVYRPTDSHHIAKHPTSFAREGSGLATEVVDIELPAVLWRNVLRMVRRVLLKVDARSGELDQRCGGPAGGGCSTLLAFDFRTYADWAVSLAKVQAEPTMERGLGHAGAVLTDWGRLVGAAATQRGQYLEAFKGAVRGLLAEESLGLMEALPKLLALADERWGRGVRALQPVFPTSGPDAATVADAEELLSPRALAVSRLSSRLLQLMGVDDDGDMAHGTKFKPAQGIFLPSANDKVIFGVGTEDAARVHVPLLEAALRDFPHAAPLHTFAIAGSGDQFLTVLRFLHARLRDDAAAGDVEMTVADNNPRQVELVALKLAAMRELPLRSLGSFLLHSTEGDAAAREAQLAALVDKAKAQVPGFNRSYWLSGPALQSVRAEGLFGVDASTRFWAANLRAEIYTKACSDVDHWGQAALDTAQLEKLSGPALMEYVLAGAATRVPCLLDAISALPYFHSAAAASGWPLYREVGRGWMDVCLRRPASWFCLARFRLRDAGMLPPWLDATEPEALAPAPFSRLRVAFRPGDVAAILEELPDASLALIDLTNLPSALPPEVMAGVFRLAARKLHPKGVVVAFVGPLLSGGVCHATGGDTERCFALLLRLAADAGLGPRDDWPATEVGESYAWYVAALKKTTPAA